MLFDGIQSIRGCIIMQSNNTPTVFYSGLSLVLTFSLSSQVVENNDLFLQTACRGAGENACL